MVKTGQIKRSQEIEKLVRDVVAKCNLTQAFLIHFVPKNNSFDLERDLNM